jgi:DNA invertase Pin-like site-specific DNA recombinase
MQRPEPLPRESDGRGPTGASLASMLGKFAHGDVATVTRIDRLARRTFDLFGIVKRILTPRLNSAR